MKYYKYLFFAIVISLSLANNIFAATAITPISKYDNYLSDHPLTAAELKSGKYAAQKILSGKDTYTYVRCYYKLSANINTPKTDYVWAQNSNGSDYKLNGYWYADGISEWKNMFYTNTLASDIKTACETTLKKEGKNALVDIYAADNFMSFDHTIWHNKLDNNNNAQFDKIISFGDSLSDTHNVYNGSQWKLPNNTSWYLGRFSNYKLWTEYLAEELKVPLYSWAVGGASGETNYILIPSLSQQIQSYEEYMKEAKNYNPDKTLFTIWIGSNDLVKYKRTVDATIADIDDSLYKLINTGAKHIIILNLPDATIAPTFKYRTDAATIEKNIRELNTKLAKSVNTIKWAYGNSVDLQLFDANATFNDLMVNSSQYGISNITDSCLDINDNSSTKYIETHKVRAQCIDADKYAFWDLLHPTTIIHKLLADKVLATIKTPQTPASNDFIYINNFGGNNISIKKLDSNNGLVTSTGTINISNPLKEIFDDKKSYAYILNSYGSIISMYQVGQNGALTPLVVRDKKTAPDTIDMEFFNGYVYAITSYNISVYKQNIDGSLTLQNSPQYFDNSRARSITIRDNKAYILNDNNITVYNLLTADGKPIEQPQLTIRFNDTIHELKFGKGSYSNFGFVISGNSKTISAINFAINNGQSASQVSTLDFIPTGIEISNDGLFVYAIHSALNKISILAVKPDGKLQLVNTINTPYSPGSISINKSGKFVFITHPENQMVSEYKVLSTTPYLSNFSGFDSGGYNPISAITMAKY